MELIFLFLMITIRDFIVELCGQTNNMNMMLRKAVYTRFALVWLILCIFKVTLWSRLRLSLQVNSIETRKNRKGVRRFTTQRRKDKKMKREVVWKTDILRLLGGELTKSTRKYWISNSSRNMKENKNNNLKSISEA